LQIETDWEVETMIARLWKGWTAADNADEVLRHLRDVTLARFASSPGHVSATVFSRPAGGGVEVMTVSTWASPEAVPTDVEENHRLLVARETMAAQWQVVDAPAAIARAA
jgi:hypothetical protein